MDGPNCEWCGKPIRPAFPEENCQFAFCCPECEAEYEKEQIKDEKRLNQEQAKD